MKRISKIFKLIIIISLILPLTSFAATPNVSLDVQGGKDKNYNAGDIVKFDLSIKCNTDFKGLNGILKYDTSKLKRIKETSGANFNHLNGLNEETKEYNISVLSNSEGILKEGICQTIEFEILDNVKPGEEITITLENIDFKDGENETHLDNIKGSFKIAKEEIVDKPTNNNSNTNLENNTSNNSSINKDNTTANQTQPYTGLSNQLPIIIFIIALLGVISLLQYKKYKDM